VSFNLIQQRYIVCLCFVDTEIDWKAYMEQVEQYVNGEHDYTKIKGGTGPLVYPAAHVYIYWILYQVSDKGKDILLAQRIFGVLYLATVGTVMACYRRAKVWTSSYIIHWKVLIIYLGPAIHLSIADTLETTTQHLRSPTIQRLFRRFLSVGSNLLLPTSDLDHREHGIQLGPGYQDDIASGVTCNWGYALPC
jgi:hypothetical protein